MPKDAEEKKINHRDTEAQRRGQSSPRRHEDTKKEIGNLVIENLVIGSDFGLRISDFKITTTAYPAAPEKL